MATETDRKNLFKWCTYAVRTAKETMCWWTSFRSSLWLVWKKIEFMFKVKDNLVRKQLEVLLSFSNSSWGKQGVLVEWEPCLKRTKLMSPGCNVIIYSSKSVELITLWRTWCPGDILTRLTLSVEHFDMKVKTSTETKPTCQQQIILKGFSLCNPMDGSHSSASSALILINFYPDYQFNVKSVSVKWKLI